MDQPNYIENVSNVIVALAALGALYFAYRGIKTWQDELHGRNRYDLARRLLLNLYRVREAISQLRNDAIVPAEWANRPGRKPDAITSDADDVAYVYQNRLNRLHDAREPLRADLLEAEVLWGPILGEPTEKLEGLVRKLRSNLRLYVRAMRDEKYAQRFFLPKQEEVESIIWIIDDDNDAYGNEVRAAISSFEAKLKPMIGARAYRT